MILAMRAVGLSGELKKNEKQKCGFVSEGSLMCSREKWVSKRD